MCKAQYYLKNWGGKAFCGGGSFPLVDLPLLLDIF